MPRATRGGERTGEGRGLTTGILFMRVRALTLIGGGVGSRPQSSILVTGSALEGAAIAYIRVSILVARGTSDMWISR